MRDLRFAAIGAGFWARFQLSGWREAGGTQCVAICNRSKEKAESLAAEFSIPRVYTEPEAMLAAEDVDFVDIITAVETHGPMVKLAARHGKPVVCQKPLATTLEEAQAMLQACQTAGVPLLVNENWRWQPSIREVAKVLQTGVIGTPFRARIDMISGFPVFANQPFLKELEQFIITDLGSHTLDVARFLFGEAETLYCQNQRVHTDIRGEDVSTIHLKMRNGMAVLVQMAYAENHLERDRFPETCIFIEASKGSLELQLDHWLRVTTSDGTHIRRVPPPRYAWADPAYDVIHSSIVGCQANLAAGLRGEAPAETTGEDNLETVKLVFGCYESAASNQVIALG
ncbi:MAG: Gfo/Idh/MocA family oxidoreductase [Bryobacterales bacterium]|nr:Gfo/Idh/MocA family oxidoreductase [Bryobacterales bacterium]